MTTHPANRDQAQTANKTTYPGQGRHAGILDELGRAIVGGSFAEGVLLPRESQLQERFAASRQTVREALKVLAAKGMVRARKRAGTFVQPRASWNLLDPDVLHWHPAGAVPDGMLRDLFEIRYLVEPHSAQFAAERGDPEKVARIARATAAMALAGNNPDLFYEADIEFHLAIFGASGNELIDRLSHILRPLLEVNFSQRHRVGTSSMKAAYKLHAAVYNAIASKSPGPARLAMEALLDGAAVELFGPNANAELAPRRKTRSSRRTPS